MNRKLSQREHARRLARALRTTTNRYLAGCIGRKTWDVHMRALWTTVHDRGLTPLVIRELGITR